MRKELKNSIPYFLLLAGVIIFFHSILPHDHHYAVGNTQHTTHSQHPDNSPVHCHALNDLITVFSKTGLNDQTIKILSESILIQNIFSQVITESGHLIPFKPENSYHHRLAFISISPTRGSPA